MLIIGANVGLGKSIVAHVPVSLLTFLRFSIAVAALAPVYRIARMRRVSAVQWLQLLLQAFFGTFLFTLLMLAGVSRTSAVASAVITSTLPAVVALGAWAFLGEKPQPRTLVAIALAVAGVVLVARVAPAHRAGGGQDSLLGNFLVLGAVCCESVYVLVSRRVSQGLAALEVCAYTHLLGLALCAVGALVMAALTVVLPTVFPPIDGTHALPSLGFLLALPAGIGWLILWYGLSASIFSFWLWMRGIRHVPGNQAGVFTAMVPIAAAAYGIVVLGEAPRWQHAAAFACVLAGIVLASSGAPRRVAAGRGERH